jgi:hypothetical protein
MTFQQVVDEVQLMDRHQSWELMQILMDKLAEEDKEFDLIDFVGVAKHLADDVDPQDYINTLRSEWDHRP